MNDFVHHENKNLLYSVDVTYVRRVFLLMNNFFCLFSVQETIKSDNTIIKEKYSALEDKFNQLINITDISISDLDLNIPRYCVCTYYL